MSHVMARSCFSDFIVHVTGGLLLFGDAMKQATSKQLPFQNVFFPR